MTASYQCRIIAITCRERATMDYGGEVEDGKTYNVWGLILPDGRLLTLNAESGDDLWASVDAFQPNGLDEVVTVSDGEATRSVELSAVVEADRYAVAYGNTSLLTDNERLLARGESL